MPQEVHDLGPPERALADLDQQPTIQRQPADCGEMIMSQQRVQNRSLAPRRIRPDDPGQGIEGRFVYPDDSTPLALGFAKRPGQRSVLH